MKHCIWVTQDACLFVWHVLYSPNRYEVVKHVYLYPEMQWSGADYGYSYFTLNSVPLQYLWHNLTFPLLGHYYWFQWKPCYLVCITLKRNCIVQWAINLWWQCYCTEMKCRHLTWLAHVGVAQSAGNSLKAMVSTHNSSSKASPSWLSTRESLSWCSKDMLIFWYIYISDVHSFSYCGPSNSFLQIHGSVWDSSNVFCIIACMKQHFKGNVWVPIASHSNA